MSLLKIIQLGHPTLRDIADPVIAFDEELRKFTKDMTDTMIAKDGIGLASPQVNRSQRVVVVNLPLIDEDRWQKPMAFINPEIIEKSGSSVTKEGCLSVLGVMSDVKRYKRIKVQFNDIKGRLHTWKADGLLAIVLQHEIDHLDGILIVDHLKIESPGRG